jgi:hypothetical protein
MQLGEFLHIVYPKSLLLCYQQPNSESCPQQHEYTLELYILLPEFHFNNIFHLGLSFPLSLHLRCSDILSI